MGWYRVCDLPAEETISGPFTPPDDAEPSLWSRGGLQGVEVHHGDKCIKIPRKALLGLVCDEIRSEQVRQWEDMDDELVMRHSGLAKR